MTNENYEYQVSQNRNGHGKAVFTGVLLGGLTGAITALLLAPHSGKDTRNEIRNRVVGARDLAEDKVEDAVEGIRTRAGQLKAQVTNRARELKQQGQDVLVEGLDRVSAAAEARKKDIQGKSN